MPITPVLRTYALLSVSEWRNGSEMYSTIDGSRSEQRERRASPRTIGS